jgi:hypothetical protein
MHTTCTRTSTDADTRAQAPLHTLIRPQICTSVHTHSHTDACTQTHTTPSDTGFARHSCRCGPTCPHAGTQAQIGTHPGHTQVSAGEHLGQPYVLKEEQLADPAPRLPPPPSSSPTPGRQRAPEAPSRQAQPKQGRRACGCHLPFQASSPLFPRSWKQATMLGDYLATESCSLLGYTHLSPGDDLGVWWGQ